MICTNCQFVNPDDARFCQNCGKPMSQRCSNCNTANDAGAKYCKKCGTRLSVSESPDIQPTGLQPEEASAHPPAPVSLSGEKRMVTILFADVVDSVSLAEKLDIEDWTVIMNRAFEQMTQAIQHYGGTVSRLLGDALLATFGAPVAHEDDPIRAAYSALDILNIIEQYSKEVKADYGIDFAIRVGINTGQVVVGDIGGDQLHEYTAMGDAVNLAARIQSAARRMSVWASEHTYRFISPVFEFNDLGEFTLKGRTEPVSVYEILKAREQPGSLRGFSGLESPMVGRQAELQMLLQLSQATEAGLGRAALVVGEAGLGKTRLVKEWQENAPAQIRFVEGNCLSHGRGMPYHLLVSLLKDLFDLHGATGENEPYDKLRKRVSQLMPDEELEITPYLGHLLSLPLEAADRERLNRQEPKELQIGYIDALKQTLKATAQQDRVAIILEDIHWADPSSVDLLSNILTIVQVAPILVCMVTRPDQDSPGWKLVSAARDRLRAGLEEIQLQPLSDEEGNELVANLLAVEALPNHVKEMIFYKSEGYPLFFEEVIRMLVDQGAIAKDNGYWKVQKEIKSLDIPDNLQGLLLARIDRLPEDFRHVMRIAAVSGRQFSVNLLELVLEAAPTNGHAKDLAHRLSELEMSGFIRLVAAQPEIVYRFHHSLIQDAVYASLLKSEQRRIHRAIGEAMETLYADQPRQHAPMLAYHFSNAGDDERALKYYTLAGDTAAQQFATSEALEHYTNAINFAEKLNQPLTKLYNARGTIFERLGHFEAATKDMHEALQSARDAGTKAEELNTLLNLGFAWAARDYAMTGKYYQQALELARTMDDPRSLAQSLIRLGNWHTNLDQQAEAEPCYEEALAIFQQLGDKEGIAETYDLLAMNAGLDGDLGKSSLYAAQAASLYKETNNLTGLASILTTLAINKTYYETGTVHISFIHHEEALNKLQEAMEICQQINWRSGKAYTNMILAQIYAVNGDIQLGLDSAEEGLTVATEIGHLQWMTACTFGLGMIHKEILAYGEARRLLESALEMARETGSMHWIRLIAAEFGSVLLKSGKPDQAESVLDSGLDRQAPARSLGQRDIWCKRVELALARGDIQSAKEGIEHLNSWAKNRERNPVSIYVGMLHGETLSAQQQWTQAEAQYRAVLQMSTEFDFPSIRWRCHMALAKIAGWQGKTDLAEQAYQLAQRIIDQLAQNIPPGSLREGFLVKTKDIQHRSVNEWQSLSY